MSFELQLQFLGARFVRQRLGGIPTRRANVPVMYNGDADLRDAPLRVRGISGLMVGRRFIRSLASRADARTLLANYVDASRLELCGDAPVLGRMKELLSYWCLEPGWNRLWPSIKMCRSLDELILCCR